MNLAEYAACDGLELAELVRRREVTPEELAALAAEGTSRVNGRLGAVIELFADRVERPLGDDAPTGPFGGVPLLLKDLYHGEAGRLCENGSRLSEGWVVPSDTGLIRRVRHSGLASLGRATTSEWGIMGTTETAFVGPTCSPWSRSTSPAARPAAPARRSAPGSCRSRSRRMAAARSGSPRRAAAWSG